MVRLARHLLGLVLFVAAAWWSWRASREFRSWLRTGQLDRPYPNEWGVRITPLDRRATAAARALEDRLLREQLAAS